jgi:hypothetical protein
MRIIQEKITLKILPAFPITMNLSLLTRLATASIFKSSKGLK